jgi:Protein of unknown function (DUF2934)
MPTATPRVAPARTTTRRGRAAARQAAASEPDTDTTGDGAAAPELLEGPSRADLIRRRAYDLYERNGRVDGRDLDNWLAAEAELDRLVMEGTSTLDADLRHQ